jgi:para-aminobenzoate synthetase component I
MGGAWFGWSYMAMGNGRSPEMARPLHGMMPCEVASRLRHLPGLVFLDTAGHVPTGAGSPVSILAARPAQVWQGTIHRGEDRQVLRDALARGVAGQEERELPIGGLCGWIEYDGNFVFGVYPEMLVFRHADGTWIEKGTLSKCLQDNHTDRPVVGDFRSATEGGDFLRAVARVKEWIAAGDIYQVNLSQAFEADVSGGSLFGLYESLREHSPAPMATWMELAGREVLCSSPEMFLRITGRSIETRPIKGTRPRFAGLEEDRRSADELQASAKEISELVMITDLLRNDIGQVCEFGSVEVVDLMRLESLAQVHHLVSTVRGRLREGVDALEAVAACFPGGSITGAPKKRAMEIIRELEPSARGLYCGAIGYLGFNGESMFNLAIRTLVREGGTLSYHVGAGIVADSDPQKEYEETLHKAAGIRLALEAYARGE